MKDKPRIGFALCGSFCTFKSVIEEMQRMSEAGFDLYPILSEHAAGTDTRFGTAIDFKHQIRSICGRESITSMTAVETFGPGKLLDALVIAPCTGTTLGKLAAGISDTTVTFAAKSCLRNDRPVILAISTNDALSGSAANIGTLLARRGYYFVPFGQDDPETKPRSAIADLALLPDTVEAALSGRQLQPILR